MKTWAKIKNGRRFNYNPFRIRLTKEKHQLLNPKYILKGLNQDSLKKYEQQADNLERTMKYTKLFEMYLHVTLHSNGV